MSGVARVGDIGSEHDGYPATKILTGSSDTLVNGIGVSCKGDQLESHKKNKAELHERFVKDGSSTVTVNGKPVARIGDPITCGGVIITGSSDTIIG